MANEEDPQKRKVLDRIKALLDKAASTEHEAEADSFIAGAGKLIAKHRIDESELADDEDTVTSTMLVSALWGDLPYGPARGSLLGNIAKPFGVFSYAHVAEDGITPIMVSLVGLADSIDIVLKTFTLLQAQIDAVALTANPVFKVDFGGYLIEFPSVEPVDDYRSSMIMGFGLRVGERLAEGVAEAEAEADLEPGVGLVLVDDFRKAESQVRDVEGKDLKTPTAPISSAGIVAGAAAGDAADLGGPRINRESAARHIGELT